MKQLLLILSILLTCTATQAQRYRLVADSNYYYKGQDNQWELSSYHDYRYIESADRPVCYTADTLYYDTVYSYQRENDIIKLNYKKIVSYNAAGLEDTAFVYNMLHDTLRLTVITAKEYDAKEKLKLKKYYGNIYVQKPAETSAIPNVDSVMVISGDDTLIPEMMPVYKEHPIKTLGYWLTRQDSFLYKGNVLHSVYKKCLLPYCALYKNQYHSYRHFNSKNNDSTIVAYKQYLSENSSGADTVYYTHDTSGVLLSYYTDKYAHDNDEVISDTTILSYDRGLLQKEVVIKHGLNCVFIVREHRYNKDKKRVGMITYNFYNVEPLDNMPAYKLVSLLDSFTNASFEERTKYYSELISQCVASDFFYEYDKNGYLIRLTTSDHFSENSKDSMRAYRKQVFTYEEY